MFENNDDAKIQYEIDKKNENIINEEIKEIIRHTKNTEDVIKLTETVRNYRTEIYKIKLNLKDYLSDIYQTKKTEELKEMENRTNEDKEIIINNGMENYVFDPGTMSEISVLSDKNHMYPYKNLIKILESIKTFHYSEYTHKDGYKYIYLNDMDITLTKKFADFIINNAENLRKIKQCDFSMGRSSITLENERIRSIKKIEEDLTNQINSYRIGEILHYYEKELSYWQEMNLEKSAEISDSEHFFE